MTNRTQLFPALALALVALTACKDGQVASAPMTPPPVPGPMNGMVEGYVDGKTMTATFTPINGGSFYTPGVSPQVYGAQGSTVDIFGTVTMTTDSLVTHTRTWDVKLGMRNRLAWMIGTNYPSTTVVPPDSAGVFLGLTSAPIVTIPAGFTGSISVINAMGVADWAATGQPYFWYNQRLYPLGTSGGRDTTLVGQVWRFRATFNGTDTANSFRFAFIANAQWPSTNDVSWTIIYNGLKDSLPDTQAEPRWRRMTAIAGQTTPGTANWFPTGLVLAAGNNTTSIYFSRRDSLGTDSAAIQATGTITTSAPLSNNYKAIIGLAEPQGGGGGGRRQVFLGIADTMVAFVTFSNAAGTWSTRGTPFRPTPTFNAGSNHTYKIRKNGATNVVLCVDGNVVTTRTYGTLQTVSNTWAQSTTIFGNTGRTGGSTANWTSVTTLLGNSGSGC